MTLMAESKEELKSLLVRMKEGSEEVGLKWDSLVAQMVKNPPANVGDLGSIPGLGRFPGGGLGKPIQYSCLENTHGQRSLAGYSP